MRPARFIPKQRPLHHRPRKLQHVFQLPRKSKTRIRPLAAIAKIHILKAFEQFHNLLVGQFQPLVIADHGRVLSRRLTQLAPQPERIFRPFILHQPPVDLRLPRHLRSVSAVPFRCRQVLGILQRIRSGFEPSVNATNQ